MNDFQANCKIQECTYSSWNLIGFGGVPWWYLVIGQRPSRVKAELFRIDLLHLQWSIIRLKNKYYFNGLCRPGAEAWSLMYPSIPKKLQDYHQEGFKLVGTETLSSLLVSKISYRGKSIVFSVMKGCLWYVATHSFLFPRLVSYILSQVIFSNESNIERWTKSRQKAVDSKLGRVEAFIKVVKVPMQVRTFVINGTLLTTNGTNEVSGEHIKWLVMELVE